MYHALTAFKLFLKSKFHIFYLYTGINKSTKVKIKILNKKTVLRKSHREERLKPMVHLTIINRKTVPLK